jgi:hypothetical protein
MLVEFSDFNYDIDRLVGDVEALRTRSEDDILNYAGNLLVANGLTVSGSESGTVVVTAAEVFNLQKSLAAFHLADSAVNAAAAEGGKFKERLEYAVCSSPTLYKLLGDNDGNSTVKDTIKKSLDIVVPMICSATVAGALAGFWVGLIAAALALMLKIGYAAYCATYWDANGKPDTTTGEEQA